MLNSKLTIKSIANKVDYFKKSNIRLAKILLFLLSLYKNFKCSSTFWPIRGVYEIDHYSLLVELLL